MKWCPTIELHDPPPAYGAGAPLSELEGRVWCRWLDLHQLPAAYRAAAHLDVLQRRNGTHGVSRTLATSLRRARADGPSAWVGIGTREWSRATAIRVRSTVPESLGPRALIVVVSELATGLAKDPVSAVDVFAQVV
jgi:hypothetical protein